MLPVCPVPLTRLTLFDRYTEYTNAQGQETGTFSSGQTQAVMMPDCFSWVSGLDADWDCQRPDVFTGCVITETQVQRSTSVSNSNNGVNG